MVARLPIIHPYHHALNAEVANEVVGTTTGGLRREREREWWGKKCNWVVHILFDTCVLRAGHQGSPLLILIDHEFVPTRGLQ